MPPLHKNPRVIAVFIHSVVMGGFAYADVVFHLHPPYAIAFIFECLDFPAMVLVAGSVSRYWVWPAMLIFGGSQWYLITWFAVEKWPQRQAERPTCGRCGYDLTGNMSGVCPECGTPV